MQTLFAIVVLNYYLICVIQTFIVINYLWGFIYIYYCNMNLYNLRVMCSSFYNLFCFSVLHMQFPKAVRRSSTRKPEPQNRIYCSVAQLLETTYVKQENRIKIEWWTLHINYKDSYYNSRINESSQIVYYNESLNHTNQIIIQYKNSKYCLHQT